MRRFAVLALVVVAACSKSAPSPGKEITIENACSEKDQTRVRVSGYLRYERSLLSFCDNYGGHKKCDLMLYGTAEKPASWDPMHAKDHPEPPHLKLSVPVGDSPGEMKELPDKFTEKDILVYLSNKATASEGAKVTVDGTLSVVETGKPQKSCWVTVEWAAP